jgi:uncharacterized protein YndB with AHSA1/START domain
LVGAGRELSGPQHVVHWADLVFVFAIMCQVPETRVHRMSSKEAKMTDYVATAEIEIDAPPDRVWTALTDPQQIKEYMFGSQVVTDWKPGSPIVWKGEYEGKKYEDKGEIVEIEPERQLKVTHFSPLSGQDDVPENYHTLLYELEDRGGATHLSLSQDNNPSEGAAEHSRATWEKMLTGLKQVVERS